MLAEYGLPPGRHPGGHHPGGSAAAPTPGEFANLIGLAYHPVPGRTFDLVVVGTGPAGLAASVYGASEGLDTVALDADGSRGTGRREFPDRELRGVSERRVRGRPGRKDRDSGAATRCLVGKPLRGGGFRCEDGFHVVTLVDGSEIPCHAVIVATGARYRRLDVPNLEEFEGSGVFYAATDLESRSCGNRPVIVVGGGNSAGQAAIFLSQGGCKVSVVIRKKDLSARPCPAT